jgi:hypothetical protein
MATFDGFQPQFARDRAHRMHTHLLVTPTWSRCRRSAAISPSTFRALNADGTPAVAYTPS